MDKLRAEHEATQRTLAEGDTVRQKLKEDLEHAQVLERSLRDEVTTISAARDGLKSENSSLSSELDERSQALATSLAKIGQLTSELAAASRSEETSKTELRTALRRAEEAEKTQHDLQEEGTGLMRSLEEMRPKIIELTGVKLELSERVEMLTKSLSERDSTISDLERQLESAQDSAAAAVHDRGQAESELEKEKANTERNLDELQKAYSELQNQLDDAHASVRELEADRKMARQTAAHLQEEVDNHLSKEQKYSSEIASLQGRLEEQQHAREDSITLVDQLQQEVENLRSDLASKEEELNRMRQAASAPPSPTQIPRSLSDEVQNALKQQYELEISSSQSTIRTLEASLYDTENQYLALQKQCTSMEEEIAHLNSLLNSQRSHAISARDSLSGRRSDDLRRTSLGSQRSDSVARLPSSVHIDENLPPATRHRRRISLAMLQARMASEAEVALSQIRAHASPRSIPPTIQEHPSRNSLDSNVPVFKRPQFLDESHVFWCASCKGDLIVL